MKKHTSPNRQNFYEQEVMSFMALSQRRPSLYSINQVQEQPGIFERMELAWLNKVIWILSLVDTVRNFGHRLWQVSTRFCMRFIASIYAYRQHWSKRKNRLLAEFAVIGLAALMIGCLIGSHSW